MPLKLQPKRRRPSTGKASPRRSVLPALELAQRLLERGTRLRERGKLAAAEPLYLQSLKLRKKAYGPRHHYVAMCMSNLAILTEATGRHAKAESLFRKALKLLEASVGPSHELTAYTRANLADFLLLNQRPAEALALARQAHEDLRAALPPGHLYNKWARAVLRRAKKQRSGRLSSPTSVRRV